MSDIVVTGIGVIAAIGTGRDAFWQSCRSAKTGIKRIAAFDTSGLRSNIAGWIDDFNPRNYMSPRSYRRMSRISRLAVCASVEALNDSGLELERLAKDRIAVIVGTSYGSSSHVEDFFVSLLEDGPRGAQPFLFPETVPNAPASHIAMFHGITGPNSTFCQNQISAENAIFYARNLLLQDKVDVVLVGGADELSAMQYGCYDALGALNRIKIDSDEQLVGPIPGGGLILGEGAGVLVMERSGFAGRRGAKIYGKLKSAVMSGGPAAIGHYEAGGGQTGCAMMLAIKQAGMTADEIDQFHVSANFSSELDLLEYHQLKKILPDHMRNLLVTPLKYLTGDFGGAGIVRASAVLLSLYHQLPPAALSVEALKSEPDKTLQWRMPAAEKIKTVLMTSSTFGGGSCSLIFTA